MVSFARRSVLPGALVFGLAVAAYAASGPSGSLAGRGNRSSAPKAVPGQDAAEKADQKSSQTAPLTPNLEPSPACSHPDVEANCQGGFCRIPAGCFVLGAPRDEPESGRYSDAQVEVRLSHSFAMGRTEVTYAEWRAEGLPPPKRSVLGGTADCRAETCPVSNVNLFDAMAFANRYSENRGLAPCYELRDCSGQIGGGRTCRARAGDATYACRGDADDFVCAAPKTMAANVYACTGYRLPTEAEWEYAARAGTRTAFWSGASARATNPADCSREVSLEAAAWYCANSEGRAHPVREKAANPWGLYDVLGNVAEWTSDIFDGLGYGTGPLVDPIGRKLQGAAPRALMPDVPDPLVQYSFVTRGGHHASPPSHAKSSKRALARSAGYGGSDLGFRLARTL
jgi:sulfatase modifying factor 1